MCDLRTTALPTCPRLTTTPTQPRRTTTPPEHPAYRCRSAVSGPPPALRQRNDLDRVLQHRALPDQARGSLGHVRLARVLGDTRAHRSLGRLGVGPVDRRPHGRRPSPAHAALRAPDPLLPPDAAHPAGDAEDPEEVQGQAGP